MYLVLLIRFVPWIVQKVGVFFLFKKKILFQWFYSNVRLGRLHDDSIRNWSNPFKVGVLPNHRDGEDMQLII